MHTQPTGSMRAIAVPAWGPASNLEEVRLEVPQPAPGEVLVRVIAAGVNAADWKNRATGGLGLWGSPPVLGWDVSGVVAAVGVGVTLFSVGDEVFGVPRFPHQGGAYAEYVTAPARHFALKPIGIDHFEAAALPLAGLTALQALVDTAQVTAGSRVLIHAAAGGLGHIAVQVAKALNVEVIGTASAEKHDFVRALGVDVAIDYTASNFEDVTGPVDVVLDTIGGEYGGRSLKILRPGGTLISLASPHDGGHMADLGARGVRTGFMLVEPDHAGLVRIGELVESEQLRVHVAHIFPLSDAAAAHRYGETGRTTGKLVLAVA